jgi:hypothetical protein
MAAMRLARILTIFLVPAVSAVCARAQHQQLTSGAGNSSPVLCADGLSGRDCQLAQGIVRLSLKLLSRSVPDWRVVIVAERRWAATAELYGIKATIPAFTDLSIRTTYLKASLVFRDGRVDESLEPYTSSQGSTRLAWVIAHEYGHILCETRNEQKASAAAGRLIYGRRLACP